MRNVPAAIERSMAAVMREFADLGGGVAIRPSMSPTDDSTIDNRGSKHFPQLRLTASPPQTDDNQATLFCELELSCESYNEDDGRRTAVKTIYEAAQGVCDRIFDEAHGWYPGGETTAQTAFEAAINTELGTGNGINVGGYTFGPGQSLYDDGGINIVALTFRVHYTRIT